MTTFLTLLLFILLTIYWRFATNQILVGLQDESYCYSAFAGAMAFGTLFVLGLVLSLPQIMYMTCFILLSPVIALVVYDAER